MQNHDSNQIVKGLQASFEAQRKQDRVKTDEAIQRVIADGLARAVDGGYELFIDGKWVFSKVLNAPACV